MTRDPRMSDQSARIGIAKGAPWAFLAAMTLFVGIAVSTSITGDADWKAAALAMSMIPATIIAVICVSLVNGLLAENEDLRRQLRTARH